MHRNDPAHFLGGSRSRRHCRLDSCHLASHFDGDQPRPRQFIAQQGDHRRLARGIGRHDGRHPSPGFHQAETTVLHCLSPLRLLSTSSTIRLSRTSDSPRQVFEQPSDTLPEDPSSNSG